MIVENYKPLILDKLKYAMDIEGLTMGEILYTIHRQLKREGYNMSSPASVLEVTGKDFYKAVCKIESDTKE